MSDRLPMTRTGYDKLKAEVAQLEEVEMPIILERIANARAEGDLSENAEFDGAIESQGMLQRRINVIRDKLSRAALVDPKKVPKDEVAFGSTVVVKDLDLDDEEEFTLVGAGEEDYDVGKILVTSTLAQGLMGKKLGDRVEIVVPAGTMRFEILQIRFGEDEWTMWFLAFALALPMGEVKSEIKDDERVVFYPTYAHQVDDGRAWNLSIHGLIFEPEEGSLKREAALGLLRRMLRLSREQTETRIFKQRARAFLVDNEGGKTIAASLGGKLYEVGTSGANGHFGAAVKLPATEVDRLLLADPDRPNWLTFEAVTRPDDRRTFTGQVRLIGPKGLSVISDVDDTIKISMVTDRRALVRNTFLREFDAVDGMSALYRTWAGTGAAFHYLSGSPWQLYGPLSELLHKEGFPPGSFHLKLFRLKDSSVLNMLRSQRGYKSAVIERILADFPHRRFILVGDSSEEDPEIYADAARRHGEQVLRIFIRRVDGSDASPARIHAAFEGLPPDRWRVFRHPQELADALPPTQPAN